MRSSIIDLNPTSQNPISRRYFMKAAAAGIGTFTIIASHVLGANGRTSPNEKINIAGIGYGGIGEHNIKEVASENIVALCEADPNRGGHIVEMFPKARLWNDYRRMLDEQKNIDAVIIATPDHTHAVIALEAIRRGKHVYVQKPLTRTVYEARLLTQEARKYGVITQMGNQGHSSDNIRNICEWIWNGAIGPVREVHSWTSRPVWPQPVDAPTDTPPLPVGMSWDLWIGPARMRPYHSLYHPRNWRAFWDFGTGALGDMACHILDPVFWALKLKYPTSVEACGATEHKGFFDVKDIHESFPSASIIRFEFPAREEMPPVKLTWWDGGLMPPRPPMLEPGRKMGDNDGGVIFYGDKGALMCGCYANSPRLIPETAMQAYKRPPKTIPRVQTSHEMEWVNAIRENRQPGSSFDFAGPFTEAVVMGNLALRNPYRKLEWDGDNMRFTNDEEANAYVRPFLRNGWTF